MNNYEFDLDLDKRYSSQVVIMRQADHQGTTLTCTLYDHDVRYTTTGITAYFVMRFPDASGYYRKQATYNAGVITHVVDEEFACSVPGRTEVAYFELHQGTTVIASTSDMTVIVLPSGTEGMSEGQRYDDEIAAVVRQWLDDHPEATTTVVDDSITTGKIKDGQITTAKIANGAVTTDKIDGSSVTTAKIDNLAVTEAKLGANAVTTAKIADGVVTYEKLAGMRKLTAADIDSMF